ncbi:hypothetical protein LCGC14_0322960 [marine sediment metagenome]|uniref:Uncharacterized protein n=1 Tax=marine sediment metagenome TaxID=412755 RepID=A0A0F9U189_9ZZZZ
MMRMTELWASIPEWLQVMLLLAVVVPFVMFVVCEGFFRFFAGRR